MTARARLQPLLFDLTGAESNPATSWADTSWFRASPTYHFERGELPWRALLQTPALQWLRQSWIDHAAEMHAQSDLSDAMAHQGPGATAPASAANENGTASVTASVAATGNAIIDGVLSGIRWNEASITYSDTDSPSDYPSDYLVDDDADGVSAQFQDFSPLTAAQRRAFHAALDTTQYSQLAGAVGLSVEGFTELDISYAGPGAGEATIRAANSGDAATAYAFYPDNDPHGGDAFYGNAYDGTSNSFKDPIAGNYGWHGVLHELGHALGLKHGQDAGGPGDTALPAVYNSLEFSVMTYPSFIGDTTEGYDYEPFGAPQTFMMADILALQTMYGADFTTNGGNTVYSWDPSSGNFYVDGALAIAPGANRVFSTIWDGNGIDTYDLSNYATPLRINLKPGSSSTFSAAQLAYLGGGPNDGFARGNVFNAFQFEGDPRSLIENANGGSNNDSMTGNAIANVLRGNGGDDRIDGGAGNDTLYGGDGDDILQGGPGVDRAYGNNGNDRFIITTGWTGGTGESFNGGAGTDTFDASSVTTAGFNAVINLDTGSFAPSQGGGAISLSSVEAAISGGGNDTLTGSGGANRLRSGDGNDRLFGLAANDWLIGDSGDDLLIGGTGADILDGGAGRDTASYAQASSGVTASLANAALNAGEAAGDSFRNIENLVGSAFGDHLYGRSDANNISGGRGNDLICGAGGNDILTGGAGADAFLFNTAIDKTANIDRITDFSVPSDTIRLDNAIFAALGSEGVLAASAFRANTSGLAADASDRILYETDTGRLFYDSNGNESGGRAQFASLAPGLEITHLDFMVV